MYFAFRSRVLPMAKGLHLVAAETKLRISRNVACVIRQIVRPSASKHYIQMTLTNVYFPQPPPTPRLPWGPLYRSRRPPPLTQHHPLGRTGDNSLSVYRRVREGFMKIRIKHAIGVTTSARTVHMEGTLLVTAVPMEHGQKIMEILPFAWSYRLPRKNQSMTKNT